MITVRYLNLAVTLAALFTTTAIAASDVTFTFVNKTSRHSMEIWGKKNAGLFSTGETVAHSSCKKNSTCILTWPSSVNYIYVYAKTDYDKDSFGPQTSYLAYLSVPKNLDNAIIGCSLQPSLYRSSKLTCTQI